MPKIDFSAETNAYRITLNAPPLNILDIAMLEELEAALAKVTADKHALLITGAGSKAFSAGASVKDHTADKVTIMLKRFHGCFRTLARLDLVTVALVDGVALGGGCELALACDFVLASDRAKFALPEISLGVFPPVAAYQMSRQLAPRKGLELMLTGESIDTATAERLGLVNAVFSTDNFASASDEWMQRLYRHSSSALRFAKRAYRLATADEFEEQLERVERLYLDELMKTADANEGIAAFMEKRKPDWSGR